MKSDVDHNLWLVTMYTRKAAGGFLPFELLQIAEQVKKEGIFQIKAINKSLLILFQPSANLTH